MAQLTPRPFVGSDKPPLVNWYGQSGQRFLFELHPIGTTYFSRSGVYIFCRMGTDGRWKALYIGECASFLNRLSIGLRTHHRWNAVAAAGATHICTLHVPGELALREGIETDLRHALNPPCNLQ